MAASLCESCQHMRPIHTARSRFLLCELSGTNSAYAKYPPQPVLRCAGHQKACPPHDLMLPEWCRLLQTWNVNLTAATQAFDDLATRYSEPGRYYHTLVHIQNVLQAIEDLGSRAEKLNAIKLAAWLHDVIYNSKAADNEERSADYAVGVCNRFGIPEGRTVAALILQTKRHDAEGVVDAQILLDADLAILGARDGDYEVYAAQIRQEYSWVPESEFRRGRIQVLTKFLARLRVFHLLDHLEERARRNLAREIALLESPGHSIWVQP